MSCGGSHLGNSDQHKKPNFLEYLQMIIPGQFGFNCQRHLYLRNRLLDQGYKQIRLIRSLKKFIFRYQDLVEIYSVSAETIANKCAETIISDAFSYSENV
jgi:hypothetical protein